MSEALADIVLVDGKVDHSFNRRSFCSVWVKSENRKLAETCEHKKVTVS